MSIENDAILGLSTRPDRMSEGQNGARVRLLRIGAIAFLTLLMSALLSSAAAAENSPARKLGRGIANLSLGVMAIPGEIIETTRESGPAVGMTWGLIKGTGMMAATEVIGLWEVLTCPFATPPDYTPILDPEFPWQRFTDREKNRSARKVRTATAGGRRARE
jgi:putative exosortase-associated protein (TIGR04073 family)